MGSLKLIKPPLRRVGVFICRNLQIKAVLCRKKQESTEKNKNLQIYLSVLDLPALIKLYFKFCLLRGYCF